MKYFQLLFLIGFSSLGLAQDSNLIVEKSLITDLSEYPVYPYLIEEKDGEQVWKDEYSYLDLKYEKSIDVNINFFEQNINLIKDGSGDLWLAGMASNQKDENIMDLYKVENENFKSFSLQKVYRRNFGQNPEGLFRWGAGIYTDRNGIQILATPENIEEQTTIQIYE